ncbi:hypothetical protein ABIF65_008227 [Bradyrhizobium japonicum]
MLVCNYYHRAELNREWSDVWSAQCDDDCPYCGARHMPPYRSKDAEECDDE